MKAKKIILGLCLLLPLAAGAAPVLVETDWVAKRLDDPKLVLVDMSDPPQYARFHLPGAVELPQHKLLKMRKRDRIPVRLDDQAFYRLLGGLGISADSHVVIYDDMGGLNAGRLFWLLERAGHARVSVMNGGLVKWVLEGRPVTDAPVRRKPATYRPAGKGRDNEASLEDVLQASKAGSPLLLDVRSAQEYAGSPKMPRTGHIPGARWWSWQRGVDFNRRFTRRPAQALLKDLAAVGAGDKDKPLITYCQSGHRASQAYLTLRSLGYERVKVYSNSMNEYAKRRDAPLKTGLKP